MFNNTAKLFLNYCQVQAACFFCHLLNDAYLMVRLCRFEPEDIIYIVSAHLVITCAVLTHKLIVLLIHPVKL